MAQPTRVIMDAINGTDGAFIAVKPRTRLYGHMQDAEDHAQVMGLFGSVSFARISAPKTSKDR